MQKYWTRGICILALHVLASTDLEVTKTENEAYQIIDLPSYN